MLIEGIFCFIFPMPLLETRINSWQVCSKISTTTTKSMVTVLCKVVGSRIKLTNHKEIISSFIRFKVCRALVTRGDWSKTGQSFLIANVFVHSKFSTRFNDSSTVKAGICFIFYIFCLC